MGTRRESREFALQFLYQQDADFKYLLSDRAQALKNFWSLQDQVPETRRFTEDLISGVLDHLDAIDGKIKVYAKNWEFHRIALVDRNILRLAIYELLFRDDIPPVVSINEAIELAKKFSTEDSGRFVNGILDRVKLDLSRPLRHAVGETGGTKAPKAGKKK
jgi:transcription antitermination protein NusB